MNFAILFILSYVVPPFSVFSNQHLRQRVLLCQPVIIPRSSSLNGVFNTGLLLVPPTGCLYPPALISAPSCRVAWSELTVMMMILKEQTCRSTERLEKMRLPRASNRFLPEQQQREPFANNATSEFSSVTHHRVGKVLLENGSWRMQGRI